MATNPCKVPGCTQTENLRQDGGRVNGMCRQHWSDLCRSGAKKKIPLERWLDERRYRSNDGYVMVRSEVGPAVPEHRLVMEQELGRPLGTGESVHHINGIRTDNSPGNLELWVGPIRHGARASDLVCRHCGSRWSDD